MRVDALLSRYGYCSRREAAAWVKQGRVVQDGVSLRSPSAQAQPDKVLVDGEPVPFPQGVCVALHKPVGYTCSHDAADGTPVYELLPPQWLRRTPPVQTVGRLDKETSGLLLITDDGALLHALTSPKRHVPKVYAFVTSAPVPEEAAGVFASGELLLRGEKTPCLPAQLVLTGACSGELTLHEGRYHQVRRMLAAVGAPVVELQRIAMGALRLEALHLAPGDWTPVDPSLLCPTA